MERARIDSPANPRVKALVRLRERRERDRSGTAPVEGVRELARALQAGVRVREAFLCPALLRGAEAEALLAALDAAGVPRTDLSEPAFAKASGRQGPDGVLGVVETPALADRRPPLPDDALVLVLAGLEKPGNLGALLRTADAAGVDAVALTGGGTDPWNPAVVRASMGSVFALPLTLLTPADARAWLREAGVRLVATTPRAETLLWDADLASACAIVLGPEHEGLDEAWLDAADARVRVPMAGLADSLNVGVTGALLAFEARRQRRAPARVGPPGGTDPTAP